MLHVKTNVRTEINLLLKKQICQALKKKVHNLKINIASKTSDITTKLLKKNIDIFAEFLWKGIHSSIKSSTFSSCLKSADVTPLHRKGKTDKTDNYILRKTHV